MTRLHKTAASFVAAMLAAFTITPLALADMNGIDVSGWQSSTVTCDVPADFAIVKVTGGLGFTNPSWVTQADCALNTGKELGLYHYAGDGYTGSGADEANRFVNVVSPYLGRAVLILDWEDAGNGAWLDGNWIRDFVNTVHARTGVWPMVYTSAAYVWNIPEDVRANCGLWVAQYANMEPTGYQSYPWNYGADGEAMRQYTASGYVNGYGPLDLNVFRGDRVAWRKYANPTDSGQGDVLSPAPTVPTPQPSEGADLEALATAVIRGDYGNDPERRERLGDLYGAVMEIVNRRLAGEASTPTVPAGEALSVVVQYGDTISGIAARYGRFPLSAWSVPSGDINRIYPGDIVTYGGGGASTPAPAGNSYTVVAGDTLGAIAARFGVSVGQIQGYASGDPNLIYPGEVLHW